MKTRAGSFIQQPGKYRAFIPKPLPPHPPVRYTEELQSLLSRADRSLARLDGIITVLPNPDLFIAMYLKKEALLSSQIEGAWEEWIGFFLKGIVETSEEATSTAREIIALKEGMITRLYEHSISSIHAVRLIDLLFQKPLVSAAEIVASLSLSKESANELVKRFEKAGIFTEISGKQRYRRYLFKPYVDLIARGTREWMSK